MNRESRAINDLMAAGMSRREANHLVRDEGLTSGKFRAARERGIAKQRAAAKAAKPAKGGLFGGRFRGNRREY